MKWENNTLRRVYHTTYQDHNKFINIIVIGFIRKIYNWLHILKSYAIWKSAKSDITSVMIERLKENKQKCETKMLLNSSVHCADPPQV